MLRDEKMKIAMGLVSLSYRNSRTSVYFSSAWRYGFRNLFQVWIGQVWNQIKRKWYSQRSMQRKSLIVSLMEKIDKYSIPRVRKHSISVVGILDLNRLLLILLINYKTVI